MLMKCVHYAALSAGTLLVSCRISCEVITHAMRTIWTPAAHGAPSRELEAACCQGHARGRGLCEGSIISA